MPEIAPEAPRPNAKLKRPNYISQTDAGGIAAIYCKVCGKQIAGFKRNDDYGEVKLEMTGNTLHVTNGCQECIKRVVHQNDLATMQAMYQADIPYAMPYEAQHPRKVIKAVEAAYHARGIV